MFATVNCYATMPRSSKLRPDALVQWRAGGDEVLRAPLRNGHARDDSRNFAYNTVPICADQPGHFGSRNRSAEQETLNVATAFFSQDIELTLDFHAFSESFHAKGVCKRGDGADHCVRITSLVQILDKASVDLDLVEGKRAEIAQRRISRSEIVQCNSNAEIAKTVQGRKRLFVREVPFFVRAIREIHA